MPPSAWFGCGSGKKPFGHLPDSRTSAGVMLARSSQVMPAGSFARTPPCTALPRDIVTPAAGWFDRSYRSSNSACCRASIAGFAAVIRSTVCLKRLLRHHGHVARHRRISGDNQLSTTKQCGAHEQHHSTLQTSPRRTFAWTFHDCLLSKSWCAIALARATRWHGGGL